MKHVAGALLHTRIMQGIYAKGGPRHIPKPPLSVKHVAGARQLKLCAINM